MADLLKHIYNAPFFDTYSEVLGEVIEDLDKGAFLQYFATQHWASLKLKQRMTYLAQITDKLLPSSYAQKVDIVLLIIARLRQHGVGDQNLEYIFLTEIIKEHGLDHLKCSLRAIEQITQFVSFEYAGRAFIMRYPKEMMYQMCLWTSHPHENVRRYASEGCRPRLPWGTKLPSLVQDPSPCFKVLEQLMFDPSIYVRKSVANHLNDISKDHPDLVVRYIEKWKDKSENTEWILRQGARTLLKNANSAALQLFGISKEVKYELSAFKIESKILSMNEWLDFSFSLTNLTGHSAVFRVEYYIWYLKSRGQYSKKIFKISEKHILQHHTQKYSKRHKFIDLTIRKHYTGIHKLSLVINGNECEAIIFELKT